MNYQKYIPVDVLNGTGTRSVLFVSACEHNCKGCYNQSALNPKSGHKFTEELADQIIADLNCTRIRKKGLTLTGGDPLHPANVEDILKLIKRVKSECPDKDIWLWTGYTLEALTEPQKEIIKLVDTFIDGKFEIDLKDADLAWRGSSNQRIFNVDDVRDSL